MRPFRTLSIPLALWALAGCASNRPVEEEPADPTDEPVAVREEPAAEAAPPGEVANELPEDEAGTGTTTDEQALSPGGLGLDLSKDDDAPAQGAAACPDGRAPLSLKLLVLLRHPTDPVPVLPADGFSVSVDGQPAASGIRVGQVHTLCVAPGDHEVVVTGGKLTRSIRASAPGHANLPVAGGGVGPVPGTKPIPTIPVPTGRP